MTRPRGLSRPQSDGVHVRVRACLLVRLLAAHRARTDGHVRQG
jgi:hypothetical protein